MIEGVEVIEDATNNRDDGLGYADRILQRSKRQRLTLGGDEVRRYPNLRWIPPTSKDAERLFSLCKQFFSEFRKAMNPRTLEALIYLKVNTAYWDIKTVAGVINEKQKR